MRLSETKVDRATGENVLNVDSPAVSPRVNMIARTGVFFVGQTWAKYAWSGMPLSRANDLRGVSGLE